MATDKKYLNRIPHRPLDPDASSQGIVTDADSIRTFKYVSHEDRAAYERDGWIFAADLGPTHGHYAVLMEKIEPTS